MQLQVSNTTLNATPPGDEVREQNALLHVFKGMLLLMVSTLVQT
jgi:hypothetical protein